MQNTDGICHMKAKFTMPLMLKKIDHFCHIPTTEFIAEPPYTRYCRPWWRKPAKNNILYNKTISFDSVMSNLGISEDDLLDTEDVDIE